jgi:L-threonylcarbamoyladenylate synthase
MKNIYLNIYKPNLNNLKKAKKVVENNSIIGLPTETVYGLAGNAYSNISVKKIFKLKKRPSFNPLIIHFNDLDHLKNDAILNDNFFKLYKKFCPGPITFILNKKPESKISTLASAGKNTIAVRIPKHKIARSLLKMLNVPLAAPSANVSSKLSPTCAEDVVDEFKNKVKIILDGGKCKLGIESTIIDLTGKPSILRPGSITAEKINKVLKKKIILNIKLKTVKSPGQLKSHYYPGIPVFMNKMCSKNNQAFIAFGKKFKSGKNIFNLSKTNNLNEAANNLYNTMRKIKKKGFNSIAVCKIPNYGVGSAINERLKKASYKWKK